MFTRVEVRNFRSLRDVSVPLSNFHVLVGANGSGKTTFLDVFAFMGDMLNKGIYEAVKARGILKELTFCGLGGDIEFAFEAKIPEISQENFRGDFDSIRYEISIWVNEVGIPAVKLEHCYLFHSEHSKKGGSKHEVIDRLDGSLSFMTTEISEDGKKFEVFQFALYYDSLALTNLPEDVNKFPVSIWLKNQFKKFIQPIQIESDTISKAGKEGRPGTVNPDGSNLPWLIQSLKKTYPDRYKLWFRHIQSDFPEIKSIKTVLREDQDDMFLKIKYKEGHEVKQWMVSDGTLRFLLLTIIPYLLDLEGLFLIEEPEIGLHPRAIQSVMDSLRSVYGGQVLVTTHSPETVNCATKKELLIFSKNEAGETQIVPATEHPYFKDWKLDLGSGAFYGPGVMI
jgi:predicted ATPase